MAVTVSWPTTLPLPTFTGYAIEPLDSILRTEMEAGPARQRRRYTQTPTHIPVRWRFTKWEFAVFEGQYEHEGKDGAEWFNIDLLGGFGLVTHEVRFMGAGKKKYRAIPKRGGKGEGARWIVTTQLEVRDRPVLSEEALEIALTEDIPALIASIENCNNLVHSWLPDPNCWA